MAKMMTEKEYATPFTMLHAVSLLGQRSRLDKFDQAIQRVVKKGDYVVDIGTGSGILAILAAKAGAGLVTAIDVNLESLQYARKAAAMNDVEQIIDFFEGTYSDFIPDKKADIVICEMLSSMMLIEQQIPASSHAVEKILKPDGLILPQEITVYMVPVECPIIWNRFQYNNLKFPQVSQTVPSDLARDLADMQVLETFDLINLKVNTMVDRTLHFTMVDKGTIHGLVGVFESTLYENIVLNMEDGWKQLFIPLPKTIDVSADDSIIVRIRYQPGKYDSLRIELK